MKNVEAVTYDKQEASKRGILIPLENDSNYIAAVFTGKNMVAYKWFSKYMDASLWALEKSHWTWK